VTAWSLQRRRSAYSAWASASIPEHKYLIVETLRQAGFRCGMTGNGVNDAPALKRDDVGYRHCGAGRHRRRARRSRTSPFPLRTYNKNAGIRSQDDRVRGRDRQHAAQELLLPDWIRPEKQSFAHVN